MGSSRVDIIDGAGATLQDLTKQPGDIGPGFFSKVFLEKHVTGTRDHILHDPLTAVIGECDPIDLWMSVSFPESVCSWISNKDEISFFGRQHYIVPIDHKHISLCVADQVRRMQVRVT